MKATAVLFTITFILSISGFAQVNERALQIGSGTYLMSSLRQLQDDIKGQPWPVPMTTTSSFPPYFTFEFKLGKSKKNMIRGGFLRLESTGSRLSFSDRSGFITSDQIVTGIMGGAYFKIPLSVPEQFDLKKDPHFYYEIKLGLMLNHVEFIDEVNIYGNSSKSSLEAISLGAFSINSVAYSVPYKRLNFAPFVGVLIDPYQRTLHLIESRKAILRDSDGDDIKTRWLGFRAGIEISLR